MEDISYLNSLKMKYNYSDKLLSALDKIIPKLVEFYGVKYEPLIRKAIENTLIIECNSYQPIPSVVESLNLTKEDTTVSLIKENLKQVSSIYIKDPVIIYDELLQTYIIKEVKRYIVLAHFHNLDSPKGLATLTREISKLIRSYNEEFKIDKDILTTRTGLKSQIKKITMENNKIKLVLLEEKNIGLEAGINSYDEEKITSLIIGGNYETFDCDIPKKVAMILYERLNFKDIIISSSIEHTTYLEEKYNIDDNLFEELSFLVDKSLQEEEKNSNPEITKQEKEYQNLLLKNINKEVGNNIIFFINARAILNRKVAINN